MLWVLLFSLIFESNKDAPLLSDHYKSDMKRIVEDKTRSKELITYSKNYGDLYKSFEKAEKKASKEIRLINENRNASEKDFEQYFDKRSLNINLYLDSAITLRIISAELMTSYEWGQMIEIYDRKRTKTSKDETKYREKIHEFFNRFRKNTIHSLNEENPKRDEIITLINKLEKSIYDYVNETKKTKVWDDNRVRNKKAKRNELKAVIKRFEANFEQVYKDYKNLHFSLVEFTSEKEWKKAVKAMNKKI